jgi:predicted O-methyltransferase YrrM
MAGTNRGLNKLEQAQYLWNQGRFREAGELYRNMLLENPELARSGLSINLAHSIILATNWSDVSKNLPQGINYLESSGWIKSLSAGKPVNCELKPVPWYTYPAIEFIENKLNKNFRVFEFGSGNSTLWFSERVLQVVCVESHSEWFSYLREKISANVELNWIEDENKYADKIFEYPKEYFDVIAIDGINRNKCAESAISRLKPNGFVIFDNTDDRKYNPGIEIFSKKGFKRIDFYGLIPSYTYKNCTSVFFKDDELLSRGEIPSEKQSCLGKSCFQITNPKPRISQTNHEISTVSATSSQSYAEDLLENLDKWQLQTPVCFIIFNRPDTTEKVFEAIRQAKPPKLLVIADGPRADRPEETEKCAAARAIINRVDWDCEVLTNYSNVNLGGRKRISSGLNWVFNAVEEAIILEDDCLPHPTFFRFCEELLDRYRHDQRIMFISGNNFQFGRKTTQYSYYFSRYSHCWGWATWRRAWQHYDDQMVLWPEIQRDGWLEKIIVDADAQKYWANVFNAAHCEFMTHGWDSRFLFACWIQNGLSILPKSNLVSNIGFGPEATHTKDRESKLANMPVSAAHFPLQHPPFVIRDAHADDFTEKTVFSGTLSKQAQIPTIDLVIHQAIEQLNTNNNVEALSLLEQAITSSQNMPGLNYGKAIALARLGYINEAVEALNYLLATTSGHKKAQLLLNEIRPGSVGELMQKATHALNGNKIAEAFNLLSQAKSFRQPIIGLDYLRATCLIRMNQPGAALQSLYEELRYFPTNAEAQNLLNQLLAQYPQFVAGKIDDAEFQELLQVIRPYTMLSEARLYSLFSLAKRICTENIPGNFIECGVAGGGSTALMAAVIKRYTRQPRWLYAFDSFEGMPTPTERDRHDGILADATGWGTGTCAAPETSVQEICFKLGVSDIVRTVKGYFQDTLPKLRDTIGMIALLHMDGDWYESTKAILHNLYDRVVNDGFIQVDDYGHWEGCRQAVHDFEAQRQIEFDINPIDGTGVWFSCPNQFPINPDLELGLVAEFAEDDPVAYGIQSQMSPNERFQLYYALRQLLPETSSPLRFVEIGSFAGSSIFLNCKALKRIVCELQGFAVEPGVHPQFYEVLKHLKGDVTHLPMFSHQAAPQLQQLFEQDGNFPPFIFIDGDHSYKGVRQDIIDYFPLLAPGGIIVFHDYLPPLNDENREGILFHHAGNEPGIRQACEELMENTYGCEVLDIPLLYPTDPTQSQAHLPIIPRVFSTIRAYRKPQG